MFIFNLFSAAICSELQFLARLILRFFILNLISFQDAWTAYDRRTETKEEKKKGEREQQNVQYTSNSSNLVEDVTPQILFLDTKPFVISTNELFQVDAYF